MAWRPSDWVTGGEIDNTVKGWTTGRVSLDGRDEPLQLKLAGNCHPDLAGWKLRINRVDPIPVWVEPGDFDGMATDQSGIVGDITEQQLKHFECSTAEFVRRYRTDDEVPTTLRTGIYLEWYSNLNGRMVIQCTRLAFEKIGQQSFVLTEAEVAEQARRNAEEMSHFMGQVEDVLGLPDEDQD